MFPLRAEYYRITSPLGTEEIALLLEEQGEAKSGPLAERVIELHSANREFTIRRPSFGSQTFHPVLQGRILDDSETETSLIEVTSKPQRFSNAALIWVAIITLLLWSGIHHLMRDRLLVHIGLWAILLAYLRAIILAPQRIFRRFTRRDLGELASLVSGELLGP